MGICLCFRPGSDFKVALLGSAQCSDSCTETFWSAKYAEGVEGQAEEYGRQRLTALSPWTWAWSEKSLMACCHFALPWQPWTGTFSEQAESSGNFFYAKSKAPLNSGNLFFFFFPLETTKDKILIPQWLFSQNLSQCFKAWSHISQWKAGGVWRGFLVLFITLTFSL